MDMMWYRRRGLMVTPHIEKVTGAIASFNSDYNKIPVKSLICAIEPVQDMHGYDYPWPAGGGKQLLNPASFEVPTSAISGVTAVVNDDGTITLSGTATATSYINVISYKTLSDYGIIDANVSLTLTGYVNDNVYVIFSIYGSGTDYKAISASGVTMTFTEGQIAAARYRLVIFVANGQNCNGITVKPMICKTASPNPTEFAPYSNICPISGRTEVGVTRTGKNVLNLSEWECESNSGITIGTDDISITNKAYQETLNRYNVLNRLACVFSFHVKTVSLSNSRASFSVYADGVKRSGSGTTTIGNIGLNSVGTEKDITITVPDGTEYISFGGWAWSGEVQISNLQLSLSSTATDYEHYQGSTYSVNWKSEAGTVYGGTLDIVSGKLVVDKRYALLSDPNKWVTYSGSTVNFAYTDLFNDRLIVSDSFSNLICSYLPVVSGATPTARWLGTTSPQIGIKSNDLTVEQIKSDAADEKISICYSLATPTEIQLTPQEVRTLLGMNNIWCDSGNVTVDYWKWGK